MKVLDFKDATNKATEACRSTRPGAQRVHEALIRLRKFW